MGRKDVPGCCSRLLRGRRYQAARAISPIAVMVAATAIPAIAPLLNPLLEDEKIMVVDVAEG